jgi:hypothetical protein
VPLIIGSGTVIPVPPEVHGTYPQPTSDAMVVTWVAPDGTVWPLTTPELGWHLMTAVAGAFGAAPISIVTDANPRYGERVRHVQPLVRRITLPIRVRGADQTTFLALWRPLARAFTMTRRLGPGALTIGRPDGSARFIRCWYEQGFDGDPGAGWDYDTAVITLLCEDPYWSDVRPTVITRGYLGSAVSFITPSFPRVSSSQTLGATVATNPGDAEAWPTWQITGPASSLTATNNTTGESFVLTPVGGAMTGGQIATITTDPPSIIGTDGITSWIGGLDWPSAVLWPLQPGDNAVTFTVGGSGSGTQITLTFYPRYETA